MRSMNAGKLKDENQSVSVTDANRPADGAVLRDLGGMEHLFLQIDQIRPIHFAMTGEIRGKAEPGRWRAALDCVQERHPLLNVCIETKPGSAPHFVHVDAKPIPLRIIDGAARAVWEAEVAKELAHPFTAAQAPLLRAVLIQKPQDSVLILVAHHSIGDGLSLAYVMRDILLSLSGKPLAALHLPPSQDMAIRIRHGAVTADPDSLPPNGPAKTYAAEHLKPQVDSLRLSKDMLFRLKDRAKRETASVHGAICAAVALAGRATDQVRPDQAVRILSPVETRTSFDGGEHCACYVASAATTFEPDASRFWEMARRATQDARGAKTPAAMAEKAALLQQIATPDLTLAATAEFVTTAFAHEFIVTNLGVVPYEDRFGAFKLDALWGPAAVTGFEAASTLGVATLDGAMCLTHTRLGPSGGFLYALKRILDDALAQL